VTQQAMPKELMPVTKTIALIIKLSAIIIAAKLIVMRERHEKDLPKINPKRLII